MPPLTTVRVHARTRNILLRQVFEAVFRNFLLQIPLTLRENSGNVSGKFLQRNNCRSRDIVAESRPRAGSMLRKRKKRKRKRERETKKYILFFAKLATIILKYSVLNDNNGKIYNTRLHEPKDW